MGSVLFIISWILTMGYLGHAVAGEKSKSLGVILGILLGPLGVLIAALVGKG